MSIGHLYDDLLLNLAKYLHQRDCLALALSGENERFSILYGSNRTRLVLTECYFLSNKPWKRFFKDYISPSSITVCDVSHCYWLKAKVLLRCIIKLPNLEELHIQDTRMSLKKMPQVFEACQKIVKLSLTLKEDNLDEFKKGVFEKSSLKWMKIGFRKITHLKLFAFVVPNGYGENYNTWLAVIGLLRWCRDCTDLLIKTTFSDPTDGKADIEKTYFKNIIHDKLKELGKLWEKLKPRFAWMKKLKSLVILGDCRFRDWFTQTFLNWVQDIQGGKFDLERLWATLEHFPPFYSFQFRSPVQLDLLNGPTVKSFAISSESWDLSRPNELDDERFSTLEHLAELELYKIIESFENLAKLKYICGESFIPDLDDVFKYHKKLEHLHVHLILGNEEDEQNILNIGDWELPTLKDLVFSCNVKPSQRLLDHLMKACPNIDQVHFRFDRESLSRVEIASFFTSIRFNRLTWLDIDLINLYDGSDLVLIVRNCPKLERLFLEGKIEANTFFINLSDCFPTARNLRDLRVQWPSSQEDLPDLIPFFKALKRCTTLERLVLYAVKNNMERSPVNNAPLQDAILPFVKETMPHLIALCLVGLDIDESVVGVQLTTKIVPDRPAFWFNFSQKLPKASDFSIPRIHYEGIVNPINPYYCPPAF